jgi:glucose-1-phosphate thymidylyltransferase
MIALIPAAGHATRIWPLPCSKEIYPVGLSLNGGVTGIRPKVTCHYLLEKMRKAGVKKGFIILRDGKWDIPTYCGDGTFVDMHIAYLTVRHSPGPPYTLDQAFPFVRGAHIAFGFPDILFRPDDVFVQLKNKLQVAGAEVVLGLFPAADHRMMDMVDIDSKGTVTALYLKPDRTSLKYAWLCAVWSPHFTLFLHQYLRSLAPPEDTQSSKGGRYAGKELSVGHVLRAAVDQGVHMQTVLFKRGRYVDIGTPDGLRSVSRMA